MQSTTLRKKNKLRVQKLSPNICPEGITLEEWQIGLRKQAIEQSSFKITEHPTASHFGEYKITNLSTGYQYSVQMFGHESDWNLCSCMDFKTNQLGTCKHLEWLKREVHNNVKSINKAFTPTFSGIFLSYNKERKIVLRIGTDHFNEYVDLAQRYFDVNYILTPYGSAHIDTFIQKALSISSSFICHEDAKKFLIEERESEYRRSIISQKYLDGSLKGLLNSNLYPYQEKGVLFAVAKGKSIIADEMGLGKTIQAIGAAELLKRDFGITSVLIVCPTSLKYQWKKEIERFTNSDVLIIEGLHYQRKEQYKQAEFYKIVSYNSLANDLKILKSMSVDMAILDEAQRLKNWNTQIAKATKRLRSDYTIIISGTPLENKIEELYSLTQYIDPFCLGPYYLLMDSSRITNESGKTVGYKNLNSISNKLKNILIRRRKDEVSIDLPERIDQILFVPLTEEQKKIHEESNSIVGKLVSKWLRMRYLSDKDRLALLKNLSVMRMVSDSTFIIDQQSRHDTKITELVQILKNYFENGGNKAVVFSQWERMARIVTEELVKHNIGFQYLHGGVTNLKRKELIDQFTNDTQSRVFVSTDTGSTGLNLQVASLLINIDLPWNPAILEQRIGRIHRIGQKKNIQVINFVSTDSIEEKMLSTLNFKTALFDGILNGGANSIFLEDKQLIQLMEVLQPIVQDAPPSNDYTLSKLDEEENLEPPINTDKTTRIIERTLFDDEIDDDSFDAERSPTAQPQTVNDLVRQGVSFFDSLSETLKSPQKTKQLIDSIVEENSQTGETFIKIPITSKETVEQLFALINKIVKG